MNYRMIIFIGFLMVLIGFIVPFLMVLQVMKATFFWSFLSYGLSVAGLFLGLIGSAQYIQITRHRKKDEQEDYYKFKK